MQFYDGYGNPVAAAGGTGDYAALVNKPKINGVELSGDQSAEALGVGSPTEEQVETAVNTWLDEHPEATTTVADRSMTPGKTDFLEVRGVSEPLELTWGSAGYNMIATNEFVDIREVDVVTVVHTGATGVQWQ